MNPSRSLLSDAGLELCIYVFESQLLLHRPCNAIAMVQQLAIPTAEIGVNNLPASFTCCIKST